MHTHTLLHTQTHTHILTEAVMGRWTKNDWINTWALGGSAVLKGKKVN